MFDHSRRGQKWVTEEFYKVLDVYGFRAVMFVEWGFRPADVKRTTERIKVPGAVVKEWVRTARQEEELARAAEAAGHRESAAEFYYRAALYYGPACGVIHANNARKRELYASLIRCYEKFIALFDEAPVRRVEIPFENGKTIPGDPADRSRRFRSRPACWSFRAWTRSRNTCRAPITIIFAAAAWRP